MTASGRSPNPKARAIIAKPPLTRKASAPGPAARRRTARGKLRILKRRLLQPVAQQALADILQPLLLVVAHHDDEIFLVLAQAVQPGELGRHRGLVLGDPRRVLADDA